MIFFAFFLFVIFCLYLNDLAKQAETRDYQILDKLDDIETTLNGSDNDSSTDL